MKARFKMYKICPLKFPETSMKDNREKQYLK